MTPVVKNPPAKAEDSDKGSILESGSMATHSSILAWSIPRTEEPARLQSIESQKSQTLLKQLSIHAKSLRYKP